MSYPYTPRSPRATQRSIEEINARIDSCNKVISTMRSDDRHYFNARIKSIELKKQKMLALATFAQTQSMQRVLAEMDMLLAENDLIIELESIRRAKKFKSSENRILTESTRIMEDNDETMLIEGIPSHSTPIKAEHTVPINIPQSSSSPKLETSHTILTLRAQETQQNATPSYNNIELQTKHSNVLAENTKESTNFEEGVLTTTEGINADITNSKTVKESQLLETSKPNSELKHGTSMVQCENNNVGEGLVHLEKSSEGSLHAPKATASTSKSQKEPKKKLSQKEKYELFHMSKNPTTTEKLCKVKEVATGPISSDLLKELLHGQIKLTTTTAPRNTLILKAPAQGIAEISPGNVTSVETNKDLSPTETLPNVTNSHKDVVNLNKSYKKILSPDASAAEQPCLEKLSTKTITNISSNVSSSLNKSSKIEEKTAKHKDSEKRRHTHDTDAKNSKKPHISEETFTKKTQLSKESSYKSTKHDCKELSTRKDTKSHCNPDLITKKDIKTHECSEADVKTLKSPVSSEYSTKKDKMSSSELVTRKTKMPHDALELSTHSAKKFHKIEETTIKERRSHELSKSGIRKSKRSHHHRHSSKRVDNIFAKKDSNTRKSLTESPSSSVDTRNTNKNIVNDEKAILYMSQLVSRAMEKGGEDNN